MASKIKNIIIFTIIAVALILIYIFFIKKSPEEQNLISSTSVNTPSADINTLNQNSLITSDLLTVLLSVKSIKLDDTIFSNIAFTNLHDSSILLVSPGDEGRPNPFAPIGFEAVVPPITPPATQSVVPSDTTSETIQPTTTPLTPTSKPSTTNPVGSTTTPKTPSKDTKTP